MAGADTPRSTRGLEVAGRERVHSPVHTQIILGGQ